MEFVEHVVEEEQEKSKARLLLLLQSQSIWSSSKQEPGPNLFLPVPLAHIVLCRHGHAHERTLVHCVQQDSNFELNCEWMDQLSVARFQEPQQNIRYPREIRYVFTRRQIDPASGVDGIVTE
ncbi:hypothetical protein KQX54_007718 [Cotesia glomerata]|uniref:Uncharacterized protein n=1 Tax=Cotesia glomerata TaxID=32391 RepID=A0AAV7IMD6_COTGL|nr:hypothetical protein KQX54_007718 [Cotesia glomerata]